MFGIGENYEKLWRAIIRPPRAQYTLQDLGPKVFKKSGLAIKRTDFQIKNKRGMKLVCSHFEPVKRVRKQLPCVIYLHANSSCRLQGMQGISSILCHDITLVTFDFAGSGLSEGQYVSLGYYQREDVDCVFQYLRGLGTVSSIGLWGRSMGAVTALMYADTNHQIGCLVLDSPFSNLKNLCRELAEKFVKSLSAFTGIALSFVSSTIKEKNNFDIEDIDPLKHVKNAYIPALFIAATGDDFIQPNHSKLLYQAYSGEKQLVMVEGDHNSRRQSYVFDKISSFFYFGLHVKDLVVPDPEYIQSLKKNSSAESKQQKIMEFQEPFMFDPDQQIRMAIELSIKSAQQQQLKKKSSQKK